MKERLPAIAIPASLVLARPGVWLTALLLASCPRLCPAARYTWAWPGWSRGGPP